MAIGWISSISHLDVVAGHDHLDAVGSFATPVTSVVGSRTEAGSP